VSPPSRAWNRTPDHVEEQVARLHVQHPALDDQGGTIRPMATP
jgi:hypothetical protein